MAVYDIRDEKIRLMGRYDKEDTGFMLHWSGACAEMMVKGARLDVTIECNYTETRRPYVSFEVDGLQAQLLSPLPGTHEYAVFIGLTPDKAHHVRITKECMSFSDGSYAKLISVSTDGELVPLKPLKRKIEFIGDSITAGEGCRGPVKWDEWVPMMFCCTDNYSRMTADALKAEYQVVAISGWGTLRAWDNNPECYVPRVYDRIYHDADKPYDFSFDPDTVVIALGTNDNNALIQPAWKDPKTGEEWKLHDTPEDLGKLTDAACAFAKDVHAKNPRAKIVWISFFEKSAALDAIEKGVKAAASEGTPVTFHKVLDLEHLPRGGMGSRWHPGHASHKHITKELIKIIK